MSFSGSQGRRLDHNTFLAKPRSNGNPAPTSYIIISPPKPEKWSVKDTSVNIANAFTQAATDMNPTYTNPNNSWASTSRTSLNVPRSTSVEYEATAPTAFNRKPLAPPPPDRLGRATTTARKPPSKTPSIRHVPDSEGEEDGRGKSPFGRVVDLGKQALTQATFYVRQRSMSHDPEEQSIEQTPAVNGNGNESSYDYADEEETYHATQNKRHGIAQRRGRISVDNKAYKPPLSETDSELSDDGKTRRKKRKKGPTGGPLSTLPVLSADKAKKKKKKTQRKNLETQEDESESEENSQQMEIVLPQNSNAPVFQISNSHMSQEPGYDDDDGDVSMEGAEQGLHSIPEVDEQLLDDPSLQQPQYQRLRSRKPAPRSQPPTSVFSIGGLLGNIVYYVIKIFISLFSAIVSFLSLIAFICGLVVGTIYDIILRRPGNWLSGIGSRSSLFMKYFVLGLIIFGTWYTLRGSLTSYLPNLSLPSRSDVYQAPDVPASNILELAERLRRMESAVTGLSADADRTTGRRYSELLARLSTLETRFTETKKVLEAGAKARDSDGRSMNGAVHHLVDSAVSTITQDILAKPDFALHSGGARIIPSLTSPTFELRPQTLGSQMIGLVTGNGYAIGRPPVTALHHEMQNGHCWPFAGGEGQLGVALASPIFLEEVTIDHVAKSIAFDMRSAPRQMEVWGLVEGKDNIARVRAWKEGLAARQEAKQPSGESTATYDRDDSLHNEVVYPKTLPKDPEYIRLANFTYNIYAPKNVQRFPVTPEIRELGVDFGIVVLRVLNNWGREDFTCLYRFRVHGQRIGEIPAPYSEDVLEQP